MPGPLCQPSRHTKTPVPPPRRQHGFDPAGEGSSLALQGAYGSAFCVHPAPVTPETHCIPEAGVAGR